jgi:hypothetical protein
MQCERPSRTLRLTALLLALCLLLPLLTACGGPKESGANLPPIDDTRGGTVTPSTAPAGVPPQQHTGLSNKQKVVLLVGAAALYYMYKKHRDAQNQPANVQYYLSKNGRVYYRDANHQAHWVTPPAQGIQVPADEAQDYRDFQGYNNQNTGRDLVGIGND